VKAGVIELRQKTRRRGSGRQAVAEGMAEAVQAEAEPQGKQGWQRGGGAGSAGAINLRKNQQGGERPTKAQAYKSAGCAVCGRQEVRIQGSKVRWRHGEQAAEPNPGRGAGKSRGTAAVAGAEEGRTASGAVQAENQVVAEYMRGKAGAQEAGKQGAGGWGSSEYDARVRQRQASNSGKVVAG